MQMVAKRVSKTPHKPLTCLILFLYQASYTIQNGEQGIIDAVLPGLRTPASLGNLLEVEDLKSHLNSLNQEPWASALKSLF